jgi:Sulfotransferase domain
MNKSILARLAAATLSPFRRHKPRRVQLYCVGTAKSGTHSVASMFASQLRSSHEAESDYFIDLIIAANDGKASRQRLASVLRARDRRLWLEVDSSQLNYFVVDLLVELFDHAKFILTIRDCYSWLDSLINHQLARRVSRSWQRMRDLRFQSRLLHPPEEASLQQRGLYTLDGYLSYWATHNRRVIEIVPPDRLLIVRTHEISKDAPRIANFARLPIETADGEKSHTFPARARFNVLAEIDADHLERKVHEHCRTIMAAYFPQIRCVSDAIPRIPRYDAA